MYFKNRNISGKIYKYAVRAVRAIDGKVKHLEIIYKKQNKTELENTFNKKEKKENLKIMLSNFKTNHIFTEEEFEKIEDIRVNYRRIMKRLSKASRGDLFDRFTANFTYESNALEGNSLTLKDVVIVMFENASIKAKDLREIYETRNSRKVVETINKNKFDISHKSIIKMHKMLVKDIEIQIGYKKVPNAILGRELKTALPENVKGEMDSLIKWYDKNKEKIHPIELAALFHGKFEQIHPFEDGNGRVGRFLINVILVGRKYPPLIIRKSQRIAYLKALENFDNKHSDTLRRFVLERFKETYRKFFEIYAKYV
jgi:Fic family protein